MTDNVFGAIYNAISHDQLALLDRLRSGQVRLAHYTSAENGLRILKGGSFWLRNTKCMNDYSEVQHGKRLVFNALTNNSRQVIDGLKSVLDRCAPRAFEDFVTGYGNWLDSDYDVFLGCLSEHLPDDSIGRLSMWRAYGSNNGGVCFIFNSTPFTSETTSLGAYSVPVSYYSDVEFGRVAEKILEGISALEENMKGIDRAALVRTLTLLFVFRAISLKHPGFNEEKEWRIVLLPEWGVGRAISTEVVSVTGVPQLIYKIPLRHNPEEGLYGADIANLVWKVIIGPSEYPEIARKAYIEMLSSLGVEDAAAKVKISGIPLRPVR